MHNMLHTSFSLSINLFCELKCMEKPSVIIMYVHNTMLQGLEKHALIHFKAPHLKAKEISQPGIKSD